MLQDDTYYLYLIIIKPILKELNSLSLNFQIDFVDLGRSYDDIINIFIFLAIKIIKRGVIIKGFEFIFDNIDDDTVYLNSNDCYYGIGYNQAILNMSLSQAKKSIVKKRAHNFINELLHEITKRLPNNIQFFKQLKLFSPNQCLNQLHAHFSELPFVKIFLKPSDLALVQVQWDKLIFVTWKMYLNESHLNDSNQFWPKVYKVYKSL